MRAATQGRALVLEGIEKAERNVLPVLNNLLENREMHLEDGRFLIESHTYDKLLEVCTLSPSLYCLPQKNESLFLMLRWCHDVSVKRMGQ